MVKYVKLHLMSDPRYYVLTEVQYSERHHALAPVVVFVMTAPCAATLPGIPLIVRSSTRVIFTPSMRNSAADWQIKDNRRIPAE